MNVTVTRESDDRLERQVWRWWVGIGSWISVSLRSYGRERRATRRHRKWQLVEWWWEYTCEYQGGGVQFKRADVPMPPDVREEARSLVVAAIRMEG